MADEKTQTKKAGGGTFWMFLLLILMFGLTFQFEVKMGEMGPTSDITNYQIKDIFGSYYLFSGLVFGLLSGIIFLFINLFSGLMGGARYYYRLVALALAIVPWYFMAHQFVYNEPRYTDFARAVISYIGYPLLATTKFLFLLILIVFVVSVLFKLLKKFKKTSTVAVVLLSSFSFSGCLGGLAGIACFLLPDSDHCYQMAAIQENDPDSCAKIRGEDFADSGSNPPRDKCYLNIAKNTDDLSVCDKIEGGMYSYTKEECYLDTATENDNPSGCAKLSGSARTACINAVGPKITAGGVIEIDQQIKLLEDELKNSPDASLQEQLQGLRDKKNDYLAVMTAENKSEYESISDPRNQDAAMDYYAGRISKESKDALVALNDKLRGSGNPMTEKEYKAVRDGLAYRDDPKNNIENMDPGEIVKLRWNEKLANGAEFFKFWKANKTSKEEQYDEQLLFYERMMERQEAIEKGWSQQQQDFARETGRLADYIKEEVTNKVMDEAKKQAFGELMDLVESDAAGPVTAVLGEAIDVVKAEAKSQEFQGLVRAYNKGMEEMLGKAGGNVEVAHASVVAELQKNPYAFEDRNTFAKYGNLLENRDCDGTNPHCLKKDIFWKAMKKSFAYQQANTQR